MFHDLNQDEREKYILNLIYDLDKYQEIKKKEKPDFELKKFDCSRTGDGSLFEDPLLPLAR